MSTMRLSIRHTTRYRFDAPASARGAAAAADPQIDPGPEDPRLVDAL